MTRDDFLSEILGHDHFNFSSTNDLTSFLQRNRNKFSGTLKIPASEMPNKAPIGLRQILTEVKFHKSLEQPARESVSGFTKLDANHQSAVLKYGESFVNDRFSADPLFGRQISCAVKRQWLWNSLHEKRGHGVFGIFSKKSLAGIVCSIASETHVTIDLIAVSAEHRGQGIGKDLVSGLQQHFGLPVMVSTQDRNIPSINLYIATGFRAMFSTKVFHYHSRIEQCTT